MIKSYTPDLFQSQSQLIDAKVELAVNKTIDRVIDKIDALRNDMDNQFSQVRDQFSALKDQFSTLKERVTAVETTLLNVKNTQTQINTKLIEYQFKAGWLLLATGVSYIMVYFFGLLR